MGFLGVERGVWGMPRICILSRDNDLTPVPTPGAEFRCPNTGLSISLIGCGALSWGSSSNGTPPLLASPSACGAVVKALMEYSGERTRA
jgi:hypothetical protein